MKRTVSATGEEINYEWSDYNRLLKVTSTVSGVLQENKYDIDGIRDRKPDKNGNTAIESPMGYMTTASRPRNASSNASANQMSGSGRASTSGQVRRNLPGDIHAGTKLNKRRLIDEP